MNYDRNNMLELKNLSFKSRIIDDLSLKIKAGEIVVITGPNGSGKSTLAQLIMGIKTPSAGRIFFDSKDITDLPVTERANLGIAFSFQQPVRFKGVTVERLLDLAGSESPAKLLKAVGLEPSEYLDRELDSSLSGGEMKRIEIASVLARKVRLMIFDEPEAGIDMWSFDNLTKVFQKIRKEIGDSSIIIISHQEKLMKIADRIVVLENGQIKKDGPAEQILAEIKA